MMLQGNVRLTLARTGCREVGAKGLRNKSGRKALFILTVPVEADLCGILPIVSLFRLRQRQGRYDGLEQILLS